MKKPTKQQIKDAFEWAESKNPTQKLWEKLRDQGSSWNASDNAAEILAAYARQLEAKIEKLEKDKPSIGLLRLVADIRAAVGDPTGKLMQDELVEHCRKLYSKQRKP